MTTNELQINRNITQNIELVPAKYKHIRYQIFFEYNILNI